jgi:hypothetical protein
MAGLRRDRIGATVVARDHVEQQEQHEHADCGDDRQQQCIVHPCGADTKRGILVLQAHPARNRHALALSRRHSHIAAGRWSNSCSFACPTCWCRANGCRWGRVRRSGHGRAGNLRGRQQRQGQCERLEKLARATCLFAKFHRLSAFAILHHWKNRVLPHLRDASTTPPAAGPIRALAACLKRL